MKKVLLGVILICFTLYPVASFAQISATRSSSVARVTNNAEDLHLTIHIYDTTTGKEVTTATQEIGQVLSIKNNRPSTVTLSGASIQGNAVQLISLTGQQINLTKTAPIITAQTIPAFGSALVDIDTLSNFNPPLFEGGYKLQMRLLIDDIMINGVVTDVVTQQSQIIVVADDPDFDPVLDLIDDVNWTDMRLMSISGTNWNNMNYMTTTALDWSNFEYMLDSGINWSDVRIMSSAGINWVDMKQLTYAGANWIDLDYMLDSGINWTDMHEQAAAGVNWVDVHEMSTAGVNWPNL